MNQRTQTAVFHQIVDDVVAGEPVIVDRATTVADAVGQMAASGATAVIVTEPNQRLAGILTMKDVVNRLAYRVGADTAIAEVMTYPVKTIFKGDYLYHAIARMRRFGHNHMPVVDTAGRPVGMLRLSNALAAASARVMDRIDHLTQEGTLDGLREVKAAQIDLAEDLFNDSLPSPEIQAVLTHLNNDINRRVVEINLAKMREEGMGDPLAPFAMLMMGSGGRGENFLRPDQDNGFVLEDYPDKDHTRIDGWFIDLAERVTRDLDAIGFPLCHGYVMATNPIWRKTPPQWREQTSMWVRRRTPFAIRFADIFFDFAWVYGERDLVAGLREHVTEITRRGHAFLLQLYQDNSEAGVALGWFGRFITDKENPAHKGEINMKHSGTMPLVQAVRLLALKEGVPETATLARIDRLRDGGILSENEADYLTGAFRHITHLLLRSQIQAVKAGRQPDNYVNPRGLTERERDMLVDAFKAIQEFHKRLRSEFTADVF